MSNTEIPVRPEIFRLEDVTGRVIELLRDAKTEGLEALIALQCEIMDGLQKQVLSDAETEAMKNIARSIQMQQSLVQQALLISSNVLKSYYETHRYNELV